MYRQGFSEFGVWREALNLADYLPPTSAYKCALANDDELARELVRRGIKATPAKAPPLADWTPEVEALTNVADLLNSFRFLYLRHNGGKGQPPAPMPRPVTAMQRARTEARRDRHAELTQRLLGRPPT